MSCFFQRTLQPHNIFLILLILFLVPIILYCIVNWGKQALYKMISKRKTGIQYIKTKYNFKSLLRILKIQIGYSKYNNHKNVMNSFP